MNKLIVFLLAISHVVFVYGQRKTSLQEELLHGTVSSVEECTYKTETEFGDVVKGEKVSCQKKIYNMAGFLEKEIRKNGDTVHYSYDKRNLMTDITVNEKKTELCSYDLDSFGRILKRYIKDSSNNLQRVTRYTYNSKGIVIGEENYDANGKLEMSVHSVIGVKGVATSATMKYPSQSITISSTMTYNSHNDMITMNVKMSSTLERIVKEWEGAGPETKMINEYTYDPHGNWIKNITRESVSMKGFSMGDDIKITERTITYY